MHKVVHLRVADDLAVLTPQMLHELLGGHTRACKQHADGLKILAHTALWLHIDMNEPQVTVAALQDGKTGCTFMHSPSMHASRVAAAPAKAAARRRLNLAHARVVVQRANVFP